MLVESDKQLALLAVSRYGADKARVGEALAAVRHAQSLGRPTDFLDVLVKRGLLTASQARHLRFGLDDTHLDPDFDQGNTPRPEARLPIVAGPVPRDEADLIGPATGFDLRVVGEYRVLSLVGEGGMGAVYRAYDETANRYVALKILADALAQNPSYVERFHREARSVAKLNHPNIVRSLGAGHDPRTDKHYLVLEYVDGPSAHALLDEKGRLSVGDAVHIALDIARALEHVHSRSIIHRDIKPDNILLTRSGVAKLSDLGLARFMGEVSSLTNTRQGFGTPYYMPYEQAYNARSADGRSDIFALGATLYHLVTGEVPFPGDNPLAIVDRKKLGTFVPASQYCPDVPPELDRILARMMAFAPQDRYRTASELIVDLDRSQLAAPVPSFVDPEVALQDPIMRQRLTAPAQPTQFDLSQQARDARRSTGANTVWFLRYRNKEGRLVKGRLSAKEILCRLEKGRLSPRIQASRAADGDYQPLAAYPEFQDAENHCEQTGAAGVTGRKPDQDNLLQGDPADQTNPGPVARWIWLAGLGVLALLGGGSLVCWFLFAA